MTGQNQHEESSKISDQKQRSNKAKKIFYNVSGISDFQLIFRNVNDTKNLLKERVSFIKAQTEQLRAQGKPVSVPGEKSFEDVMSNAKLSKEDLIKKATKYKRYWLIAMVLSSMAMLFTGAGIVRLIVDGGFNWSLIKPLLTFVLFSAVVVLGFIKCVTYEFLGWRLVNACNSEAEEGTYPFFVADYGLHNSFKFDKAGRERGER